MPGLTLNSLPHGYGPSDVMSPEEMYRQQMLQQQQQQQQRQIANMPAPPHTLTPYPGQAEIEERVRQMQALKGSGLPQNVQDYINTQPSRQEWENTIDFRRNPYPGGNDAPDGVAPTPAPFGRVSPPNINDYYRGPDDPGGLRQRLRGPGWPA